MWLCRVGCWGSVERRSAFTLIELLVTIAVIAILLAVAAPSFLGHQDKAHDSAVRQNLAVAYRAAHAARYDEGARGYPAGSQLRDVIGRSEPQLAAQVTVLGAGVRQPTAHEEIGVCAASDPDRLMLVSPSRSGRTFLLTASIRGMSITEATCPDGSGSQPGDDDDDGPPQPGTGDDTEQQDYIAKEDFEGPDTFTNWFFSAEGWFHQPFNMRLAPGYNSPTSLHLTKEFDGDRREDVLGWLLWEEPLTPGREYRLSWYWRAGAENTTVTANVMGPLYPNHRVPEKVLGTEWEKYEFTFTAQGGWDDPDLPYWTGLDLNLRLHSVNGSYPAELFIDEVVLSEVK